MSEATGKPLDVHLRGVNCENVKPNKLVKVGNKSAADRADAASARRETDKLRAAILARDALIERIRNGEEGLLETMYAACERVEELPAPVSEGEAG